jgi:hypothetical protein
LFRLRLGRTDGSELLLLILFVTVTVNVLTVSNVRLSDNDQKYFLPIYNVVPFILALVLSTALLVTFNYE